MMDAVKKAGGKIKRPFIARTAPITAVTAVAADRFAGARDEDSE